MTQPAARRYAADPTRLPPGTLVELFFEAVDKHNLPNAQLQRKPSGWQPISHQQMLQIVHALSDGLAALGFERDDRIALLSENRPEWAQTDYAMLCSGILGIPIYPTLPAGQISYILEDSGARGIFVSNSEQLMKIRECRKTVGTLEHVIVFDSGIALDDGEQSLQDVLELGRTSGTRRAPADFRAHALLAKPEDLATLIYTSGTTGQPKGVMLTHNNIHSNVVAQSWMRAEAGEAFVTVSFLPLSHIFQRMVDYCLFWLGCTIAYTTIDNAVSALPEVKPTIAVAVPRVYEKIYAKILSATGARRKLVLWARQVALDWADAVLSGAQPSLNLRARHLLADKLVFKKVRQAIGGRIRFFVSGSAPLAPQIARFFYGAGVLILEGYGLTETSPVLAVNLPHAMRIGTVGKPIANTEIAIADDGEILARGPQVMKGYYQRPDETAEVLERDGWFHTGDIGDIDADGFLRITDRKKDLIKTAGGKYVAPQPIQNAAKQSRFVSDAVLIGDTRPYPILLIVPNFEVLTGWAADHHIRWARREELVANPVVQARIEEDVLRKLSGFARYEMPKKFLILPREFELARGEYSAKLSVRRHVVEKNFSDAIEALYGDVTAPVAPAR
ncbi:MAG TPA: long-chain fatty acid--CoA ligase [Longimicrobiales bacterium]